MALLMVLGGGRHGTRHFDRLLHIFLLEHYDLDILFVMDTFSESCKKIDLISLKWQWELRHQNL